MKKTIIAMILAASMSLPMVAQAQNVFGTIQQDQVEHAAATAAITYAVGKYTHSPLKGVLAGLAVGTVKELIDRKNGGHFDNHDIRADVGGAVLGYTFVKAF